jgi:hypothetical protein
MAYAWRVVEQFKEAGRWMFPDGRKNTQPGGIALTCRACPQPGQNISLRPIADDPKPYVPTSKAFL